VIELLRAISRKAEGGISQYHVQGVHKLLLAVVNALPLE